MPHALWSRALSPSSRHCASSARTRSRVSWSASAGSRPGAAQAAVYSRSARRSSSRAPRRSPCRRRSSAAACSTWARTACSRPPPGCAEACSAARSASRSSSAPPCTSHSRRTQRAYCAQSPGSAAGFGLLAAAPRSNWTASISRCTILSASKSRTRARARSTVGRVSGAEGPAGASSDTGGRGMNRSSTRAATSAKAWGARLAPPPFSSPSSVSSAVSFPEPGRTVP